MMIGIDDDTQSKIDNVLQRLIKLSGTVSTRHIGDGRRRNQLTTGSRSSVISKQIVEAAQFADGASEISTGRNRRHGRV